MLEFKRIVVFGASSGIGRAIAAAAAAAGANVRAVARNRQLLESLAAETGVEFAQADIRDADAVGAALDGIEAIDHVVVSAGTVVPMPILTHDMAGLQAPFEERVFGAMNVVRAAAPRMSDGSFLFVTGDLVERPLPGLGSVTAAATAVEALVATWVLELPPLRFNVLSPGVVDTPLQEKLFGDRKPEMMVGLAQRIPLKRVGRPEEAAQAALAMLSNGFINGAVLNLDGGMRHG